MAEAARQEAIIQIRALHKTYRGRPGDAGLRTTVFSGFDLDVHGGEFLTVFGPNACGKSTLLHILAGVLPWDAGSVMIDGQLPGDASVGFVFQSFQATLFPWKTNLDNVAWPLELRGVGRAERREMASAFLSRVDLVLPADGYPYQLSGGQQQLLCAARALVAEPKVLLMDEPFNQLDYQTRLAMHKDILRLWQRTRTTVVFVSHDIEEALLLGDRTVFFSKKPTRVLEVLPNPLARPRSHGVLGSAEFFELKAEALGVFGRALQE